MKLMGNVLDYILDHMLDHILDYMLDYIIIDLVTTALHLRKKVFKNFCQ